MEGADESTETEKLAGGQVRISCLSNCLQTKLDILHIIYNFSELVSTSFNSTSLEVITIHKSTSNTLHFSR